MVRFCSCSLPGSPAAHPTAQPPGPPEKVRGAALTESHSSHLLILLRCWLLRQMPPPPPSCEGDRAPSLPPPPLPPAHSGTSLAAQSCLSVQSEIKFNKNVLRLEFILEEKK